MSKIIKLALGFCALLISGCVSTQITSPPLDPKVFQLAALNQNPIHLDVSAAAPDRKLGHQFVFIGIPFGEVESKNLNAIVQRTLYQKLALRGFTPIVGRPLSTDFSATAPSLDVLIDSAQASAFDMLVTRHLSCSLDISAQLSKSDMRREARGTGTFEHFGAFAFERELSLCLSEALDRATDQLLNDLRI